MAKKSKITTDGSLKASVGAFWGNKRAVKGEGGFKFYMSYLEYKKSQNDWLAMKLAKKNRTWVLSFYDKKQKKPTQAKAAQKQVPKRKLEKITINKVERAEDVKFEPGKLTQFVDAGTKNNGRVGEQETTIACVDGHEELVFDEYIGDCTNNQGEIRAIVGALKRASDNNESLHLYSDSQIAIGWTMRGMTKASPENDVYAAEAKRLLESTQSTISWVPRDINLAGIYLEESYSI